MFNIFKNNQFIRICVLTKYLKEHCNDIGIANYLKSLIRLEHGPGTGFGAVSNTGSTDCLKEQIRSLGVHLGGKYDRIDEIYFKSKKGSMIEQSQRTKNNFRVEHTLEIKKDLYPKFETEFIMNGLQNDNPLDIAKWIIKHHIVVGIHPAEQLTGDAGKVYKENNFKFPFKKYSSPIFYKGKDVSHYTLDDITKINENEHHKILKNSSQNTEASILKLWQKIGKIKPINKGHELPPLDFAKKNFNNEIKLLNEWYVYKKNKLFDGSKWSKTNKAKELRMALK